MPDFDSDSDFASRVIWTEAGPTLEIRDRFTRAAIKKEFEAHPEEGMVELDAGLFATPVADNRYTVTWKRLADKFVVTSVVAAELRGGAGKKLKEMLDRVAIKELQGL